MARKIAVQMKYRAFSGRDRISVIAFLQECKLAWHTFEIYKNTPMWLFKKFLTSPAEVAERALVTLASSADFYHKGILKSNSVIVQFILKRFVTDGNEAN